MEDNPAYARHHFESVARQGKRHPLRISCDGDQTIHSGGKKNTMKNIGDSQMNLEFRYELLSEGLLPDSLNFRVLSLWCQRNFEFRVSVAIDFSIKRVLGLYGHLVETT